MSDDNHSATSDFTRQKYRLLLGKPGTGKSQVLICAISYTIRHELSVLVAAPVALLAQGYNSIFYEDATTDTLHGAFSIPIARPYPNEINHRINQYDLIVVDEASMISSPIFGVMASTFNRMNLRPVVVLAGDKCQQQPLQTVNGHITLTTSIINENATFPSSNAVIHPLHQQFRIVDPEYAAFLALTWFIRPTQEQVNKMQDGHVLCPEGQLSNRQIWTPLQSHPNSTVMTVSRKGAQRINTIVVGQLFQGRPVTNQWKTMQQTRCAQIQQNKMSTSTSSIPSSRNDERSREVAATYGTGPCTTQLQIPPLNRPNRTDDAD